MEGDSCSTEGVKAAASPVSPSFATRRAALIAVGLFAVRLWPPALDTAILPSAGTRLTARRDEEPGFNPGTDGGGYMSMASPMETLG
jgi:hypothetical protein